MSKCSEFWFVLPTIVDGETNYSCVSECGSRTGDQPMSMHAAVVRSFDHPPRYETHETPESGGADESIVDVLAVGLHPRVRTGASGLHYTSTGTLPMIPGIDGVGQRTDGKRVY